MKEGVPWLIKQIKNYYAGAALWPRGDLLSICLPGSGGYGPPWERDPELVMWDVINSKVSLRSAKEDYLVVLNTDLTINEKEMTDFCSLLLADT